MSESQTRTIDLLYFFDGHWHFSADGQLKGEYATQAEAEAAQAQWFESRKKAE